MHIGIGPSMKMPFFVSGLSVSVVTLPIILRFLKPMGARGCTFCSSKCLFTMFTIDSVGRGGGGGPGIGFGVELRVRVGEGELDIELEAELKVLDLDSDLDLGVVLDSEASLGEDLEAGMGLDFGLGLEEEAGLAAGFVAGLDLDLEAGADLEPLLLRFFALNSALFESG